MTLSNKRIRSTIPDPIMVLNDYVYDMFKKIDPNFATAYENTNPIFPVSDANAANTKWSDKAYIIYNKVPKTPKSPDYWTKRDTFIYGIKGDVAQTMEWSNTIINLLDRHDQAARDVNAWTRSRPDDKEKRVTFHSIRVSQIEPSDPANYATKPFIYTDLMIHVEYHVVDYEIIPGYTPTAH